MVSVCGVLALAFILIPALEIYVIIQIGSWLGALPTMGIIVVTGVAGAALARVQGLLAVRQVYASVAQGRGITTSLVSAALVLAAAVMMLTPGFLTDATGLALLLPPVRERVAAVVARRLAEHMRSQVATRLVIRGDMFGAGEPPEPPGPAPTDGAGRAGEERRGEGGSDAEHRPPPKIIDV